MGGKANAIMASFRLSAEEAVTYQTVKARFDRHFVAHKTKLYSRTLFNKRVQRADEPVGEFITDLHQIADKCEFGELYDELVRDRIIAGLRNHHLSNQLQNLDTEPSLEVVINRARIAETVAANQHLLRSEPLAVNHVKKKGNPKFTQRAHQKPSDSTVTPHRNTPSRSSSGKQGTTKCMFCGDKYHDRSFCRAKDDTCRICSKSGHWAVMCRSGNSAPVSQNAKPHHSKIHGVAASDTPQDDSTSFFLPSIEVGAVNDRASTAWHVTVLVDGRLVNFKIDTGADVSVIGATIFERIKADLPDLVPTSDRLWGPDNSALRTLGVCRNAKMCFRNEVINTDVYVIDGHVTPLLGRDDATSLKLVRRVDAVEQPLHVAPGQLQSPRALLPEEEFAAVFEGLGCMEGEYAIQLEEGAKPFSISTPRHVPIPLREPTERALNDLLKQGVIERVDHPTDWCAGIVVVPKKPEKDAPSSIDDIKVRVTVDFTKLNEGVKRERHLGTTVEECLGQVGPAKWFSKLDAAQGYFQVPLAEASRDLTTFITHLGRFRFCRMPMGLKSSSEVFQRRFAAVVAGKGVINHVDDTLVTGSTREEHDERLRAVLSRLAAAGITLNKAKCRIRVQECTFLGHRIGVDGALPLQSKVDAILRMPPPSDMTALRSFLGSANQLLRYAGGLADESELLRNLLKDDSLKEWGPEHTECFERIKKRLASPSILAHYDPRLPTRVTSDASQHGAGGVLEQLHGQDWRPVQFTSCSFSDTQRRYAMIEKEACAATLACERFSLFLIGLPKFILRVDHKPLVAVLGNKPISDLSARLQRFRMRLAPFSYEVVHEAGKSLMVADLLSRCPLPEKMSDVDILDEEIGDISVHQILRSLPMSDRCLEELRRAQDDDLGRRLRMYIQDGWPSYRQLDDDAKPFFEHRSELNLLEGVIAYKERLFVPAQLRPQMLTHLHEGHLGLDKCLRRARQAIWWPTIAKDVGEYAANCSTCVQHRVCHPEPLLSSAIPEGPWDVVGADLGQLDGVTYLVLLDAYSSYPEVAIMGNDLSSRAIISRLSEIFARHGRPNVLKTDNGPQFSSEEFSQFAREWGFTHVTSSPRHAKSNGLSESGVKVVKGIKKKCPNDFQRGLLAYRAAPNDTGYSPAQLLMSRQLRTSLPAPPRLFIPAVPDVAEHKNKLRQRQDRAARAHDSRHRASELPLIPIGSRVWVTDRNAYGTVTALCQEPRSYEVEMSDDGGTLRRNRLFLRPSPQLASQPQQLSQAQQQAHDPYAAHPPFLLDEDVPTESDVPPESPRSISTAPDHRGPEDALESRPPPSQSAPVPHQVVVSPPTSPPASPGPLRTQPPGPREPANRCDAEPRLPIIAPHRANSPPPEAPALRRSNRVRHRTRCHLPHCCPPN